MTSRFVQRASLLAAAASLTMTAAATSASAQEAAQEPGPLSIDVQGWVGGAFGREDTQAFSHCGISRPFDNGVTVIISMNEEFATNIALNNPEWSLTPEEQSVIELRVDQTLGRQLGAIAAGPNILVIPTGPDEELIEALRRGLQLSIATPAGNYDFPLTGTSNSLRLLRECVETAADLIAADPEAVPEPEPRETPGMTLEALANILTAAGVSDLQFLATDRIPDNAMRLRFVWRSGQMLGGLHQSPRGQDVQIEAFARAYMDMFETFCPDRFEPEFRDSLVSPPYGFTTASLICADGDEENYVAFFFALDDYNYSAFFHQVVLPLGDQAEEASQSVRAVVLELAQPRGTDEDSEGAADPAEAGEGADDTGADAPATDEDADGGGADAAETPEPPAD